eukprot:gnl/TRDRNA2_/TRDRNA2_132308_c2_seq1.p1 gnl/TRDRNA2_/TRDRNA2_132308_c2~~gnl/TRDRNA2_/TRDRNA2_132308_c2_seq1.p1  ORF type:complete len:105 (+),score=25.33 gnl/TRDRNA2_/TRDRNA2_132308_c2_seq1:39-317(+)
MDWDELLPIFNRLDTDGDGKIDFRELKAWESEGFHTEQLLSHLFHVVDTDRDMHITADELDKARDKLRDNIEGSEAEDLLILWASQHEQEEL